MKIGTFFKQITQKLTHDLQKAAPQVEKKLAQVARDGFDVARRAPVNLGKMPPASAASDAEFVKGLYKELLNREPDLDGFHSHMKGLENGMSRDAIRQVFLTSPEFRELQNKAAAPAATEGTPAVGGPQAGTPGKLGPVPLEGYDAGKLNDFSHRTVKYVFGRVATNYPLDSVKDKASAQALLEKMRPDLEAAGLNILEVKGDKIRVQTPLGQEWVDVIRGSGSGNPGWWWGSEGKAIPGTEGMGGGPGPATGTVSTINPGPPGRGRLPGMETIPDLPEYASANIDTSSPAAAAKSAAEWAKRQYPDLFARADDRQVDYEIMGRVIGALRYAGFDANRIVNHSSYAVGTGMRYGSDSIALAGRTWDLFIGMGEQSTPTANDVGAWDSNKPRW